ncbi:WG repeat-containing protein [Leptospira santarosai]|uniref:WG repeat-containing protein n=1 Tax=Leptospira santarosai TaxID=28183 RepID=UPI0024AF815D|nr:WG repeat-containing protein [Leptospira santarosai]MDI7218859.1 WG repeat-containing protein [Leptospira santarosai]
MRQIMRYLSILVVMFCLLQCRPDDPRRQESVGPDLLPGAYAVSLTAVGYDVLQVNHERFSENRFPLRFQLVEGQYERLLGMGGAPGFIDRTGNVVIEPRSDDQIPVITHAHNPFKDGFVVVWYSGVGDYEGHCLQRIKKASGKKFNPSMSFLYQCEERTSDMIDINGAIVFSVPAFSARSFSEGLAAVSVAQKDKYGYMNKSKIVIPEIYDFAGDFNSGLALVELKEEMFFIDKKGKKVFGNPYNPEDAYSFSDGMSAVQKGGTRKTGPFGVYWEGGLLGYMNTTGKVVIEPRFSRADFFHDGLAYAETPSGEKGYIDKTGNFKIQFKDLETSRSFSDGLAYVEYHDNNLDKKIGFVDTSGKLVLDLISGFLSSSYDEVGDFSEGLAVVYTKDPNRRMLFIDKTGKVAFDVNDINRKIWARFKKY